MNVIWSKYIQGANTLYYSRKLRFNDMFASRYEELFGLDKDKKLKILEIGCGPGALASALLRWYPNAEITAIDRDSEFISFAKEHESGVRFLEGDATALPFDDGTFDVTVSNTVSEHIEPTKFFGEQKRVLKEGGVCLLLSSRRGISSAPEYWNETDIEKDFWRKAEELDQTFEKYEVCRYPMSESQLPAAMERYGFRNISTGFVSIALTPDDPKCPPSMACEIINARRLAKLDSINSVICSHPHIFTKEEGERIKALAQQKYDKRLDDYNRGIKHWDTALSIIMVLRGIKL